MEQLIEKGRVQGIYEAQKNLLMIILNNLYPAGIPSKVQRKLELATICDLTSWVEQILNKQFAHHKIKRTNA